METFVRLIADGSVIVIFILAMYAFAFLIPKKQWFAKGWRIVAAGATSYLAAKIIGYFYQPESMRPFEKLGVDPGAAYLANPGFPSDHVLFAVFLTTAVWMTTKNKNLSVIMVILTVAMAVGRVSALVHTPLDVVGGAFIALIGAVWYFWPTVKSTKG